MTDIGALDLEVCAREPIQIPGSIQPHGALLTLTPGDSVVQQADAGAARWLGSPTEALVGCRLADLLPPAARRVADELKAWADTGEAVLIRTVEMEPAGFNLAAHWSDGLIVLEFERASQDEAFRLETLYPRLRRFVEQLGAFPSFDGLCAAAAAEVRRLTGFDRVLIYDFDRDWHGTVIAEDGDGRLPSYLGLRFPASDIPAQARELYRTNRLRIIPDATYTPSPILPAANPLTGGPLDLSQSVLRSVSPVHLEYMRNMGTLASMSVSILVEGELWGLISCHHAEPREIPLPVRTACDFLAQTLALQIGAHERTRHAARRAELASLHGQLLARMAHEGDFAEGLSRTPEVWLALAGASGAAVVTPESVVTAGLTPSDAQIQSIVAWLDSEGGPELCVVDSLADEIEGAGAYADTASGLLAIHISELHPSYVLWFRPEVVRTVTWGGDPRKPVEVEAGARIHPRKSFETWRELVAGRSSPWESPEIDAVKALRDAILAVVLRQAEERAELSGELERSNKELEAFSYSVSHDLRAPFRHIVGYAELLGDREQSLDPTSRHYLTSIQEAAVSAGRLVDDLLSFSQIGRASIARGRIDMDKLVAEARRSLHRDLEGREIDWRLGPLPPAVGDAAMLRQVWINLISNAAKYSASSKPPIIEVFAEQTAHESVYSVRDNGVGFDMAYANKLFGVFQRLHRVEQFEGTGIGLAIARRVVERHRGRIWAEGEVGRGAAFHFSLPREESTAG